MADLTANDVTVSLPANMRQFVPGAFKDISIATVSFGNGSLTYPSGGVPLPDKSKFGFRRAIQFGAVMEGGTIAGLTFKYDQAAHAIRIFTAGTEHTGGSTAVVAAVLVLLLIGE